jgi:hypothetical protein
MLGYLRDFLNEDHLKNPRSSPWVFSRGNDGFFNSNKYKIS